MYPSLLWFLLLLATVAVAYWMRREPWYVLIFVAFASVIGMLLPPYVLHVECEAARCVEHAVPDPYADIVKSLAVVMFIASIGVGIYLLLMREVARWLRF